MLPMLRMGSDFVTPSIQKVIQKNMNFSVQYYDKRRKTEIFWYIPSVSRVNVWYLLTIGYHMWIFGSNYGAAINNLFEHELAWRWAEAQILVLRLTGSSAMAL